MFKYIPPQETFDDTIEEMGIELYKLISTDSYYHHNTTTNTELKRDLKYKGETGDIGYFINHIVKLGWIEKRYVQTGREAMGSGRYYLLIT